jgi:hypothetical protein
MGPIMPPGAFTTRLGPCCLDLFFKVLTCGLAVALAAGARAHPVGRQGVSTSRDDDAKSSDGWHVLVTAAAYAP